MPPDLRTPGAILLVSCYELGHQPMGLALPAAFLEAAGYRPACVDTAVTPLDDEDLSPAALVAISVPMHTALRIGVRVAERVRTVNPAAHICFYGIYAALNSAYLRQELADSTLAGEMESSLVELARSMETEALPKEDGTTRVSSTQLSRLAFPVPSRRSLPDAAFYARLRGPASEVPAGYTEASRGCRHRCLHCPIPPVYGGRFFVVPTDIVLADIRQQVGRGIQHITFGDPDFLNAPRRSFELVRRMHAEFPALTFDFTAKVEHLLEHARRLPEFRKRGCLFVVTAAESLSDRVLSNLRKGHTREDFIAVLTAVRDAGLTLRPSWVPFTPWSAREDYLELFDFAESNGLVESIDPVQYAIRLLVPPGSLLAEDPVMQPFLRDLCQEKFVIEWAHPDPWMDQLHLEAIRLVEKSAARGDDPALTFALLRDLARHGGKARRTQTPLTVPTVERQFRLTEPWFC